MTNINKNITMIATNTIVSDCAGNPESVDDEVVDPDTPDEGVTVADGEEISALLVAALITDI
jgi:hypothetical protein